jgi:YggT family protein
MPQALLSLLHLLFWLYRLAVILRALLPWFGVGYYHPAMRILIQITEPVLGPLRRALPATGGIDFSPLVALFLLWAVEAVLNTVALSLF